MKPEREVIDGRPRFAKPSIDDDKKVKIAAIDPDFNRGTRPLSLMEYAGRHLNQQNALEGALTSAGFTVHGLTCLAITS